MFRGRSHLTRNQDTDLVTGEEVCFTVPEMPNGATAGVQGHQVSEDPAKAHQIELTSNLSKWVLVN